MKTRILPALLVSAMLVGGCASSYSPIRPETVLYNYTELSTDASLSTGYAFDQFSVRDNRKYAKKEIKTALGWWP